MDTIKILKIEPNKRPEVAFVVNSLESFQTLVNGYIETVTLEDDAVMIVDMEGKLKNNPQGNRRFRNDIIAGTMLITGRDKEHLVSLSDDNIKKYREMFAEPEEISSEEIQRHIGWLFRLF